MVNRRILHAVLVNCAFLSPSHAGPITQVGLSQLSVAELKASFLYCERSAMRGLLGLGEAAGCSLVYEELKKRAFDGDFDTFLKWWRTQSHANVPVP